MKKIFALLSIFCSLAALTPEDFSGEIDATVTNIYTTTPALRNMNLDKVKQCIQTLCSNGYAELTNDPNHSAADTALGILEFCLSQMKRNGLIKNIFSYYLHPLPDLSLRFENYTPNLSSLVLTPEKLFALTWRKNTVRELLNTPQTNLYAAYTKSIFDAFKTNPVNQYQADLFQKADNYNSLSGIPLTQKPSLTMEGALFYIDDIDNERYILLTNIPDETSEAPSTLKFWLSTKNAASVISKASAFRAFIQNNQ
jgi:hypothetical protein